MFFSACAAGCARLDLCTDPELLVRWGSGLDQVRSSPIRWQVIDLHALLAGFRAAGVREPTKGRSMLRHVYRVLNTRADELTHERSDQLRIHVLPPWPVHMCLCTDGSKDRGGSGAGWVLMGAERMQAMEGYATGWRELATLSWALPPSATATDY